MTVRIEQGKGAKDRYAMLSPVLLQRLRTSLATEEFMRRFLLHVLPSGFHRIRHYGLLANANRKHDIATARDLLHQPAPPPAAAPGDGSTDHGSSRSTFVCRHCGAPMIVIETFARAQHIRGPPGSSVAP